MIEDMKVPGSTRPWWQTSFVWDALSSGGIGITGPVFRELGGGADPLSEAEMKDSTKTLLANAAIVGGSAVGGLLGYGLFGALRDRGWGPWKAGLATGVLGGVGALLMLHAVGALTGKRFIGRLGATSRRASRSLPAQASSEDYVGPDIGAGTTKRITGTLVEHGTGTLINARVVVRQGSAILGHADSAGGVFNVYDLAPGTYKLVATTFGGKTGVKNVIVPTSGTLSIGKFWVY